jgi:hypothetical protein
MVTTERPAQDSIVNLIPPGGGETLIQELPPEASSHPHQPRQAGWRAGIPVAFAGGSELKFQLGWTAPKESTTDSRE